LDRTYNYDANGNITYIDDAEAAGNEAFEGAGVYSYEQGTNLLADIWREVPVVYGYDENGNTISANNRTFVYDLSNRLILVQDDGVTIAEYVYNALNQRIKKILPTGTRIFHYDLSGHLIAETDETGTTIAEYFYLWQQPLAMIRPAETLYYYHNDHLGTPQVLTDDSQAIVWKAVYAAFGEAEIQVEAVENPFRFPGQYYDSETGLHYNWNRYYDPKTGRYLTPDPIGLEGGINLFTYVANSPTTSMDPSGLSRIMTLRRLVSGGCLALYLRNIFWSVSYDIYTTCLSLKPGEERLLTIAYLASLPVYGSTGYSGAFFRVYKDCNGICHTSLYFGSAICKGEI